MKKPDVTPREDILDCVRRLSFGRNSYNVWADFISMSACALSNNGLMTSTKEVKEEREKDYLKRINSYKKDEQDLIAKMFADVVMGLEENPEQDFLGDIYMELNIQNKWNGQFFTPYNIANMMSEMAWGDRQKEIEQKGYISVCDSACGAGVMLIAFANTCRKHEVNYQRHVLFVGQDIDDIVAKMCYIQISLLGCPGVVAIGNSLSEPFNEEFMEKYPDRVWLTPLYWRLSRKSEPVEIGMQEDISEPEVEIEEDRKEIQKPMLRRGARVAIRSGGQGTVMNLYEKTNGMVLVRLDGRMSNRIKLFKKNELEVIGG